MLEAWRDGPEDAGSPLTWSQQLQYYTWTSLYWFSLWCLYHFLPVQRIQDYLQVDRLRLIGWFFGFSVGITLLIYIYLMYFSLPIASWKQRVFGSARVVMTSSKDSSGKKTLGSSSSSGKVDNESKSR
jgi:hypothetical protein